MEQAGRGDSPENPAQHENATRPERHRRERPRSDGRLMTAQCEDEAVVDELNDGTNLCRGRSTARRLYNVLLYVVQCTVHTYLANHGRAARRGIKCMTTLECSHAPGAIAKSSTALHNLHWAIFNIQTGARRR
jgi:hypothetical protein